jgi:bifunctional DNase/RNase
MLEVQLIGIRVDLQTNTPIVLLREIEGNRTIPIFIGAPEASAIAFALEGVDVPRPMTHDLMKTLLDELDVTLERIAIVDVQEGTYYAELHIRNPAGAKRISSRPSDAVALAIRCGAPIFVAEDLMASAAVFLEEQEIEADPSDDEPEEIVGEFLEFLDNVRPEDFE